MTEIDPVALTQALVRCPSVTPVDAGALDLVQRAAESLGFACHRLRFDAPGMPEIDNLFARLGTHRPHLCFAGHTDVVPVGDPADWSVDPFGGELRDGRLIGRGVADMKSAVAAFLAAVARFLEHTDGRMDGSIGLLITGDEEGEAVNGTAKVLRWLAENGQVPDVCLVGEPTSRERLGDVMKIGRRGSLNGTLRVYGRQGHTAYPHRADNAVHRLVRLLGRLIEARLDDGTDHFAPSHLEVTSVDVGNPATNVIPAAARATFNVRFNDRHTGADVERRLRDILGQDAGRHELAITISGESFLTEPGPWTETVARAVERTVGRRPALSTSGGTSDARFIKDLCPVVDLGLSGQTIHQVDEQVSVADIHGLTDIYAALLLEYFSGQF